MATKSIPTTERIVYPPDEPYYYQDAPITARITPLLIAVERSPLTVQEIARLLNVTDNAVMNWLYKGDLAGTKQRGSHGLQWQIAAADLRMFLEANPDGPHYKNQSPADRFWALVEKTDTHWYWKGSTGGRDGRLYGRFHFQGRMVPAHRFAWELENGPMPPDRLACHTCDIPLCVYHGHVFPGTPSDNTQDMIRKGRGYLQKSATKVTEQDVREIRQLKIDGWSTTEIATRYGISRDYAYRIIRYEAWAHVLPERSLS